jgi:hypothetical protein
VISQQQHSLTPTDTAAIQVAPFIHANQQTRKGDIYETMDHFLIDGVLFGGVPKR